MFLIDIDIMIWRYSISILFWKVVFLIVQWLKELNVLILRYIIINPPLTPSQ